MPASRVLVDLDGNTVAYRGRVVLVTGQQTVVARLLARRMPAVVSREALIRDIYGAHEPVDANDGLGVAVCKLRRALKFLGLGVKAIHKRGYRLVELEDGCT